MMVIRKLIKRLLVISKYLVIMLLVAILGLCLYIFAEVHFSQYEPRGYTSPYDRDVSALFVGVGHDMDFAAKLDRICALAGSMDEVQGMTGVVINLGEDNSVQSFTVTFQLESKWPFLGQMIVRADGAACQEYIHWRYTRKEKNPSHELGVRTSLQLHGHGARRVASCSTGKDFCWRNKNIFCRWNGEGVA